MTMLLRRQMMRKAVSDWRDLYQQVAYLQSSGTQYINTGILLQQGDKVTIKFNVSTISSTQTKAVWGYRWAGTYSGTSQAFMQETSTFRAIAVGVPSTAQGVGNEDCFSFDMINTVVIDSANDSITVNGVTPTGLRYDLSNGKAFDSTGSSVYSPCLFTFNVLGTPNTSVIPSNLSVYEYIVERNGAEIQHFLPCIRIADSKPGMYDLVGRTFYTNQGTGEFIAGLAPDLSDTDYWSIVGYFNASGAITSHLGYHMCDYQPIIGGNAYTLNLSNDRWKGLGFYDEQYNPLEFSQNANYTNPITITAPANTKYYRIYVDNTSQGIKFELVNPT